VPYLTPDAPLGNVGRVLVIPDTYLASVNGALWELCELWAWEEFGTETPQDASDKMTAMFMAYLDSSALEFTGMASPIVFPVWAYYQSSDAPTWVSDTAFPGSGFYRSGVSTINNWVEFRTFVAAGDWLMKVKCRRQNNQGIATIKVDSVDVGTMDFYNATQVETTRTLVINALSAGFHVIRFNMGTKIAASSAYGWQIGQWTLEMLP
jgi:hypothetical protein